MTIRTKISEAIRRFARATDGSDKPEITKDESDDFQRQLLRRIKGRKFTGLTNTEWEQIVEAHQCYDAYKDFCSHVEAPMTKDKALGILVFGVQEILDQSCGGREIQYNDTIYLQQGPLGERVDQIIPGDKEHENADHLASIYTHQLSDVVASIQRFADSGGDHKHIAGLARIAGIMVSEVHEALATQFKRNT